MPASPFFMEEFSECIASLAGGKASGPDGVTHEMLSHLSEPNRQCLLDHINKHFLAGSFPESWRLAAVACIHKGPGKPHSAPESYRPISLLSALYKVYARLLHSRISAAMDSRVRDRQFGFRRGRSSGTPIHILHRLQDLFANTDTPFYMFFLNWKQAFDRVSRASLLSSLARLGLPSLYLDAFAAI